MEEFTTASGKQISSTEKELTLGLMVVSTKENTRMIKNMVMEHITGLMAKLMKVSGSTESNTVRQGLRIRKDVANWDCGKTENE